LAIGSRARLDVALVVGAVTESVTVEAAVPLLDTQSAVVGTVVSQSEIANLPLAIRNWDDRLFTLPGVQGDRGGNGLLTRRNGGTETHRRDCRQP